MKNLVAARGGSAAVDTWLAGSRHPTPFLVVDVDEVVAQYRRLAEAAPDWTIYYAVKALPERRVVRALADVGCRFDVASRAEVDLVVSVGVPPAWISYGNPFKKLKDIAGAAIQGVPLFAFDSDEELHKLAEIGATMPTHRPPLRVMCRVLVDTAEGSDWPLGAKFGCDAEMATRLLSQAPEYGLTAHGVTFHVGSQQRNPSQWGTALRTVGDIYATLAERGVRMPAINIGGGLPAHYLEPVPPVEEYVEAVEDGMREAFGPGPRPAVIVEPGRHLVADAGVLRTQVIAVTRKSEDADVRWVVIDTGRFGALAEAGDTTIRYRLRTSRDGDGAPLGPVRIAGPTCDSVDILYHDHPYELPMSLQAGDWIEFCSAGAYTTCYAAAAFNGLPPPPVHFIEQHERR